MKKKDGKKTKEQKHINNKERKINKEKNKK